LRYGLTDFPGGIAFAKFGLDQWRRILIKDFSTAREIIGWGYLPTPSSVALPFPLFLYVT
jgi:hypothetical protein